MPYYKVLRNAIVNSGYSSSEIIKKCNEEYGIHLNKSHLSKLLNNKANPPREELSRAIANICGIDERKLILEGYIDTAPKEIQEIMRNIQNFLYISSVNAAAKLNIHDIFSENEIQEFKIDTNANIQTIYKELIKNEPLSDTLIQFLDEQTESMELIENGFKCYETDSGKCIELKSPLGFNVNDNSMKPIIELNDKVIIEARKYYKNSDIIAYIEKKDNKQKIKIRNLIIVNNAYIMSALNKEYKEMIYNKDDIIICGKVTNVIKQI